MSEKLTTIKLCGELGKKFGKVHKFAVASVAEAVKAMTVILPGFQAELMNSKDRGMAYAVFIDKDNVGREEFANPVAGRTIKFVPILRGSKSGGILQVVLGVVLIAISYFVPALAPYTLPLGISMVLGGVINLLSPQQNISSKNNPNNGTSYNFSGPVNTSAQGNPVPLLYGRMIVGSAVISAGIFAEDKQ
jgi:predicted phage tail protein